MQIGHNFGASIAPDCTALRAALKRHRCQAARLCSTNTTPRILPVNLQRALNLTSSGAYIATSLRTTKGGSEGGHVVHIVGYIDNSQFFRQFQRDMKLGIPHFQYTPVACIATVSTPQAFNHRANRCKSAVKLPNFCTGSASRTPRNCASFGQEFSATMAKPVYSGLKKRHRADGMADRFLKMRKRFVIAVLHEVNHGQADLRVGVVRL